MAQRKSPPPGKPTAKKATTRPAGRVTGAGSTAKAGGALERKSPSGGQGPTRPPQKGKKKSKSIVNQKQTPWGLVAATAAVVVFAAAVIGVVIATHKSGSSSSATDGYHTPEIAAAKKITGVVYKQEPNHNHETGLIKYDTTPPTGGNHNGFWADCTGTVYPNAIANENAVHMLEHGAIWITYNAKTLPAADLTELKKYVSGVDRMALSPYPNLKTPISLQAWGYQLFVNKASDPRIAQFIGALKYNQTTTPEYGATCSQPTFKQNPSTFGNPTNS
jgi:hypothetical protein